MTSRTVGPRAMNSGERFYPERRPVRRGFLERAVDWLGVCLQHHGHRGRAGDFGAYRAEIGRTAEIFRGAPVEDNLAILRYRLRRDGYSASLVQDCLAHCSLALERAGFPWPEPEAYVAAREQLGERIVGVADAQTGSDALALAVTSAALVGAPVHVLARSTARARELCSLIVCYARPLALSVDIVATDMDFPSRRKAYAADIVCTTVQAVGLDYLRDRTQLGVRRGSLSDVALHLAGDIPMAGRLLLRGLHQVFVEDVEMIMIDDARLPLTIAVDAELPGERLLYEQALELARALVAGDHFELVEYAPVLTEAGRDRLSRLVSPLGGLWAAQNRREETIVIALKALYEFQRDRDYRVVQGRVEFPPPAGQTDSELSAGDEMLIRFTEVKEGCALSSRREVIARLSIPGFLGRYLRLAGIGADVRRVAAELGALYTAKVVQLSEPPHSVAITPRLFVSAAGRFDALVEQIGRAFDAGQGVLIALRTPQDADLLMEALVERGLVPVLIRSGGEDEWRAVSDIELSGVLVIASAPAYRNVTREPTATPLQLLIPEMPDSLRAVHRLCRNCGAGSAQLLVAAEEDAFALTAPSGLVSWLAGQPENGVELTRRWARVLLGYALRAREREQRILREELVARDQYLADSLAFALRHG